MESQHFVDPIRAKFVKAEGTIETLLRFIENHSDRPDWCGEAQLKIGYLYRAKGDYVNAIATYQKAIDDYGEFKPTMTNAPSNAQYGLIDSIARMEIARCYNKMGKEKKALEVFEGINDNEPLKESWRRKLFPETMEK